MSHFLNTQMIVDNAKKIIGVSKKKMCDLQERFKGLTNRQKLLVGLVGLGVVGGMAKQFLGGVPHGHGEIPVFVSSAEVIEEKWSPYMDAIGTITAVNAVTIASEVSGLISKIHFNSGNEVQAGDVLITLNDDVEQADLRKYQAQVELSQVTLQRSKELTKTNAESKAEFDKKTATLKENEAQVAQAMAVINKKRIVAPFHGALGIRRVDLGQYIQPGTPIVTLTDLSKLYVDLTLPEHQRPNLAVGQKVEVKVDAFPDKTFEAVVTTIDPQIDDKTRAIKLQATMDNSEKKLFPGMYVEAKIIIPEQKTHLTLPETAVDYELHGTSVFVLKEEKDKQGNPIQRAYRQYVKAGERRQGRVEILDGLAVGNQVVLSGQLKLNNGAFVVVKNDDTLPVTKPLTNY